MSDPQVLERMRLDWNQRAAEDAYYYVAFGRRHQDDTEFFDSAAGVVRELDREISRLRTRDAALEIGCGPGRLLRPMSARFGEVHGVDVSDEMIRLARERLRDVPNAHPHHGTGSDLSLFGDERFDFVWSYAVFQHIPSRDVVFNYLREARRVLKTGGILRCQINGLPPHARQYDTWSGVRIPAGEVRDLAREQGMQLLALEGVSTQYLWITCRKLAPGWDAGPAAATAPAAAMRSITNAHTGEAVVPAAGPLSAMSLWLANLPRTADLNRLQVSAGGAACRLSYLGEPAHDGVSQLNAALPEGIRTGLVPVEVALDGTPLCSGWVRIMPAGPAVPRIWSVGDGINLLSGARIVTGSVKVVISEVEHAGEFVARVGGLPVLDTEHFCTDPLVGRYEFNFRLPENLPGGTYGVEITLGKRAFAPCGIEVVRGEAA